MSSKVVEANAGVHSLAMSVAPVTSWRLYDSIYTERYMNTPELNPGGYVNASISNVTAFNNFNYLLAHGSGDDNVHYQNSAHLLDMFTQAKVRGFRFRMFTDRYVFFLSFFLFLRFLFAIVRVADAGFFAVIIVLRGVEPIGRSMSS